MLCGENYSPPSLSDLLSVQSSPSMKGGNQENNSLLQMFSRQGHQSDCLVGVVRAWNDSRPRSGKKYRKHDLVTSFDMKCDCVRDQRPYFDKENNELKGALATTECQNCGLEFQPISFFRKRVPVPKSPYWLFRWKEFNGIGQRIPDFEAFVLYHMFTGVPTLKEIKQTCATLGEPYIYWANKKHLTIQFLLGREQIPSELWPLNVVLAVLTLTERNCTTMPRFIDICQFVFPGIKKYLLPSEIKHEPPKRLAAVLKQLPILLSGDWSIICDIAANGDEMKRGIRTRRKKFDPKKIVDEDE